MKRKVKARKTGKKSRKDTTSILLEGSLSKFFFFDKEHESRQEKEPLCSLPELYFSQKGYFLLATLRFMTAYVIPGHLYLRKTWLAIPCCALSPRTLAHL